MPGSTPQAARPGQGLPVNVGVTATDDSNAPVAGLAVTFNMPFAWIFSQPINVSTITVSTDANGVAALPAPGIWAIANPGAYQATASAVGATSATFDISVAGAPPTSVLIWAGLGETITAGGLGQPFVIQAVDATGTPIPYPIVAFIAPQGSPPSVTTSFNGNRIAVVEGDANGFVVSPPLMAGSVTGADAITTSIFDAPGSQIINGIPFSIVPAAVLATLSPLAGSTPQSTCHFCFFPVPVGVIARNPDGSPAPGVTVTFSNDPSFVQVPGHEGTVSFDVVTGANGIAIASSQTAPAGYIAGATGATTVTASSSAASNQVVFSLSASGAPQNRIELLSGSNQSAQVGGQFVPLVVRASDEDGPVPNAAVQFTSSQPGGVGDPTVTFNGSSVAYVPADAQGIARSPVPVANSVAGTPQVSASLKADPPAPGFGGWIASVSFGLQNITGNPGYGLLRPWQVPPLSIALGSSTTIPFAMQVLDASGKPVANAPVIFTTDSSCGAFNGTRTVTATSDANGIATSPPFKGTHAAIACATSAHAQGQSRDLTMHVFDPSRVQATISPNYVLVHYLTATYGLSLSFTEHGRPVHVAQVSVSALATHGGVSYAQTPVIDVFDGSLFIGFTPSLKTGAYAVQVTTIGGQRFLVPVVQVP